ncbi:uncharacterized protein LOC118407708 [Branchiostoma floridae]|uniref:Uncharacterized protein LOC118407708 n=1 Tax=Branchiostoma floridae TaxID=7739 RepID=A0A9J7HQY3_BRAFL|nr:uncharacterized protein LOC118407708 [Branchiostoma floridae]
MAEFTFVPPVKELHAEQTANETHIKEEPTGDTGWQQDGQENMQCQETYSGDQETYGYQPNGHPWSEIYNSWEQTTDTGRHLDEERDDPNDETRGIKAEIEESNSGLSTGELCTEHLGKESDSRESQTTDMGLQQETCDVNFSKSDNTSTSQVQKTIGITGMFVVEHTERQLGPAHSSKTQ